MQCSNTYIHAHDIFMLTVYEYMYAYACKCRPLRLNNNQQRGTYSSRPSLDIQAIERTCSAVLYSGLWSLCGIVSYIPYYIHTGSLPSIPDEIKQTRPRDSRHAQMPGASKMAQLFQKKSGTPASPLGLSRWILKTKGPSKRFA